jgi:hypothetical protein
LVSEKDLRAQLFYSFRVQAIKAFAAAKRLQNRLKRLRKRVGRLKPRKISKRGKQRPKKRLYNVK